MLTLVSPPFAETDPPPDGAPSASTRSTHKRHRRRSTTSLGVFPPHAGDPVARFLRRYLHADWPHLLVAAWIIYGPVEKLLLPWLGGYGTLGTDVIKWLPDLESMLTGFVEFPLFFAFYLWSGGDIANVFSRLAENRCFPNEARYREFTQRAQAAFSRRQWWILGVLVAIATVAAAQFLLWGSGYGAQVVVPWFDVKRGPLLFPRIVSLVLVGLVAYVVSQILIRETLAITWWRRMWRELGDDLVLHPYHPDQAAGVGGIGRHAIGVSYCLLGMTLFVFMGSLLPSLRSGGLKVVYAAVDTVRVTAGVVARPRADRPTTTTGRCASDGRRCTVTLEPNPMALADATVLHVHVVRLPSKAEAINTWVPIDTTNRAVSPLSIPMYANPEKFEIQIESIRNPLPPGVPTLRVMGVTLALWTPLLAGVWVLLLAAVVLSLGFLLWPAHVAMERALNHQLDALSDDLDEQLAVANAELLHDNAASLSAMLGAIGTLKQVRTTLLEDCETWPLSRSLKRQLGVSSALSIGSSVLNITATGALHVLRQLG